MKKQLRVVAVMLGIGLVPLYLSPVLLHAQQSEDQQAYQAGYQNGVNAARSNRPMDMNTNDWHGDRLNDYQKGYQEGYRSIAGHGAYAEHDQYANGGEIPERWNHDPESQKAYHAGFANGVTDAQNRRAMRPNSSDWHGERLTAYQDGYDKGYHSVRH